MKQAHYAIRAMHVLDTDLTFLEKAIQAGDPIGELLIRVRDMRIVARNVFDRAEPRDQLRQKGEGKA